MIHTFKACGVYIALDVHGGSVHMVDEIVYDLLRGGDVSKYAKTELEETRREISELKEAGLLDSSCPEEASKPVFNRPVIKAMCLHVAHDCNLRCKYCFAETGDYAGGRKLMSLDVAKRALLYLAEHSASRHNLEVDFFGGEPLLNFDVVRGAVLYGRELEKKYNKNIRFTITTNAYRVTDEMADFINREMKNLVISIDGRREVHDAMRPNAAGRGSWDTVLQNAKKLIGGRGDKEYYIRGTYTNRNLDFSKDVMAVADEGFREISVEPVVDAGALSICRDDLEKIREEYERLAALYIERKKEGRPFHFFHFMIDLDSGPCVNKRLRGCGAGSEYVAVTPDGDIYPCHQFVGENDFRMGSVYGGQPDPKISDKFMACHVFSKEKCAECWAKYYCSGGCFADAYFSSGGDISKPNDLSCEIEKKRVEIAIALKAIAAQGQCKP